MVHIAGWFILLGGIDGRSVIILIIDLWLYLQNVSFAFLTLASCVKTQISFSYFVPGHWNLWGMRRCLWTLQENPVGFLEPWLPQFTILASNYQEWSPYKLQIKWWMPPLPSPICSMALNLLNIYPKHAKQRLDHKGLSHCFSTKFNSSREASHYVQLGWFHFFPYAGFSLS